MSRTRRSRLGSLAAAVLTTAVITAACQPVKPARGPRVMLVGDSVAQSLALGLHNEFQAQGRPFIHMTQAGCGVVRGQIYDFFGSPHTAPCDPNVWVAHDEGLRQAAPGVVVSLSGYEIFPRLVGTNDVCRQPDPNGVLVYEPWTDACDAYLLQLLDEKRQQFAASGARWAILTTPPPLNDPGTGRGYAARIAHLNALLWQFHAQHPDVAVVDLSTLVCPSLPCPEYVDGIQLRQDGQHFTELGAAWAAARIVTVVVAVYG